MLWILSFILIFTIGGLTGLHLGSLATDIHLHDTYFVVAHFHFVMISAAIAFIGGLHHWWPKITGRMYHEGTGQLAAVVVFVGMNITFLSQFVMGSHGMPRRYFSYPEQFLAPHVVSTIGAYLMGLGFLLVAANLVWSLVAGRRAPANPWGGATLEWATTSPPPEYNFHEPPRTVGDPYDFTVLRYDEAEQNWRFPDEPEEEPR
jgi:cytochrome c oxidase subunit 1